MKVPELDAIVGTVGGGGLMAGVALASKVGISISHSMRRYL